MLDILIFRVNAFVRKVMIVSVKAKYFLALVNGHVKTKVVNVNSVVYEGNRMSTDKAEKQRLINIMFDIAIGMQMGSYEFDSREECAEWVARQLDMMGFPTVPLGSSWGVLQGE